MDSILSGKLITIVFAKTFLDERSVKERADLIDLKPNRPAVTLTLSWECRITVLIGITAASSRGKCGDRPPIALSTERPRKSKSHNDGLLIRYGLLEQRP